MRKSGSLKPQLDLYKRQVLELQSKVTEETKRADKSEFEVKRVQEKVATLQREKEVSQVVVLQLLLSLKCQAEINLYPVFCKDNKIQI